MRRWMRCSKEHQLVVMGILITENTRECSNMAQNRKNRKLGVFVLPCVYDSDNHMDNNNYFATKS
eukprot:m.26694 g.26694  ORF g.26694 m.26694 type:complete len:65 (-) comp5879_c0_seq1:256-450(-)